jgi:hypothetical protein
MALQQERRDSERAFRIRSCTYELSKFSGSDTVELSEGRAVSINMSSGGMLLMLPQMVEQRQVFKITAPSVADEEHATKVVEVCWTRPLPVSSTHIPMYLAGVRFLFEPPTSFN